MNAELLIRKRFRPHAHTHTHARFRNECRDSERRAAKFRDLFDNVRHRVAGGIENGEGVEEGKVSMVDGIPEGGAGGVDDKKGTGVGSGAGSSEVSGAVGGSGDKGESGGGGGGNSATQTQTEPQGESTAPPAAGEGAGAES